MNKIILFLLLSGNLFAEPFTVLVKSGLNVRKEPNSKSAKIGSLAFGAVVEAEISENEVDEYRRFNHFTEVIEGKKGIWLKISHNKMEGYIFSGFGLLGEWVVKSTEINKDYRLLRVGSYCDAINYDPKLNWFALIKFNGNLSLKKTEVTLRLATEYNVQDTMGQENEYYTETPLIVQSNLKDSILFLIGTKSHMEEGTIVSQFLAKKWSFSDAENFLFPEQTYQFDHVGEQYKFHAYEGVELTEESPDGYIKNYQIELKVGVYPDVKNFNLSKELKLEDTAERHCNYKIPQLILIGDINKDGLPDFIYYSHTMTESCGVCWEYHLFLSDNLNSVKPIRKVANEISCNCQT